MPHLTSMTKGHVEKHQPKLSHFPINIPHCNNQIVLSSKKGENASHGSKPTKDENSS